MPTDSHSYLEYTSSHPHSCKKAIPYSQLLRFHRICSRDEAFHSQTSQMDDMSILGLLHCHDDATQKLQEQHLIFRLGTLQPKGIN
eukprot:g10577.t1